MAGNPPFQPHPESKLSEEEYREEEAHFKHVLQAFCSYHENCNLLVRKYRRDLQKLVTPQLELLKNIGYEERIKHVEECCRHNQSFYHRVIAPHAEPLQSNNHVSCDDDKGIRFDTIMLSPTEADNLRSLLRQVMRDWSIHGHEERQKCYTPLLNDIIKAFPRVADRSNIRVLVPGAGLGRLAYEISQLGFNCQGNEFSLFMLLTAEMFLTRHPSPHSLQIYPFALPFSNTLSAKDQLLAVSVPDISVQGSTAPFSMIAGDFVDVYSDKQSCFEAIVTCYFIDTAKNILDYLQIMHRLLVPGGSWMNLGPLLYHFEGHSKERSIELTRDEIREAATTIGFRFEFEEAIDSSYTQNPQSMLQTIYKCWHFRAIKIDK